MILKNNTLAILTHVLLDSFKRIMLFIFFDTLFLIWFCKDCNILAATKLLRLL